MTRLAGMVAIATLFFSPFAPGREAFGQVVELAENYTTVSPRFDFDAVNVRSDSSGLSRLNVYVKVPNDELVFTRDDSGRFQAQFEISLVIFDHDDFQVDGKIWKEQIFADNFDATNVRNLFHLSSASFDLSPEKYTISVGLTDLETGRTNFHKRQVELADYSKDELMLSDVLFADYVRPDSNGTLFLRPKVTFDKTQKALLYAYFEIYEPGQAEQFDVEYEIQPQKKGARSLRDRMQLSSMGGRTGTFIRIDTQEMVHGRYRLKLKVSDGTRTAELEKPFLIRWQGLPPTIADLDLAIDQMRYIAKKEDVKKLQKLDDDKKLEGFLGFWKTHDPTPGTAANELMDEYYRRVNYSDESFGTYTDGWKTDRGMVYITFGPPDDVERQPFPNTYETDSQVAYDPYAGRAIKAKEYWIYYDRDIVLEFIDVTGYGEFRLRYPQIFYEYAR